MSKNKGIKMLLWIVSAVVVTITVGFVINFIHQLQLRKSELVQTILNNPDSTAVVAYTTDDQGKLVEDGYSLFINADNPLVTASIMKVVVLAAYESAVVNGEMDPNEKVVLADLEKYYLPLTDGNAHRNGLASLGVKANEFGFAIDPTATITLDEIASIMIHFSGNAETDYLISRLGVEKVNSIAGMENGTIIKPLLGATLALMNHENSLADSEFRHQVIENVDGGNFEYLDNLIDLYLHDPMWREKQIKFMQSGEYINAANQLGWEGQVEAAQLLPKGTARDYAALMARIASGQLISTEVSARMQQILESTPAEWPVRLLYCQRFGDKDGLTAGVITLVSYCEPKSGSLAHKTRVVVILTNQLPIQTWSNQVQYQGIYFLHVDLARGTGLFSRLMEANP